MDSGPRALPIVLALGTSQTLAWGSTYYLPAILAPAMAADLQCSTDMVYAAFSLALVVSAVVGPLSGRRIDRSGGRGVLVLANILFAMGLLILAGASGVWSLVGAWLVIGVGMGIGLYEGAFATLTALYGRAARGPITGITLIAGFASTVCWPLSSLFELHWGWRGACIAWALIQLGIALPLNQWLIPKPVVNYSLVTPPELEPAVGAPPSLSQPTVIAQKPPSASASKWAMVVLAIVFAVTWFTSTAMAAHLPALLVGVGLSGSGAIAIATLVGPAQVVARIIEATLLRRCHPLLSARLALVAHPLGAVMMVIGGGPLAVGFALLHGAGNGILTIAKGTLPLALFGPQGYGLRQGLLMVPARLAQAVAPFAFALLLSAYGSWALMLTAGLGILALICLLTISGGSGHADSKR